MKRCTARGISTFAICSSALSSAFAMILPRPPPGLIGCDSNALRYLSRMRSRSAISLLATNTKVSPNLSRKMPRISAGLLVQPLSQLAMSPRLRWPTTLRSLPVPVAISIGSVLFGGSLGMPGSTGAIASSALYAFCSSSSAAIFFLSAAEAFGGQIWSCSAVCFSFQVVNLKSSSLSFGVFFERAG